MNQPLVLDRPAVRSGTASSHLRGIIWPIWMPAARKSVGAPASFQSTLIFAELMGPKSGPCVAYFTEFLEEAAPYLLPKGAHETRDAYQEARKQWLRFD